MLLAAGRDVPLLCSGRCGEAGVDEPPANRWSNAFSAMALQGESTMTDEYGASDSTTSTHLLLSASARAPPGTAA